MVVCKGVSYHVRIQAKVYIYVTDQDEHGGL